jgi:aspartate racemase
VTIRLGIVGGLGPLASADFYAKLTQLTPAVADRDHVPLAILSLPQIPDRSGAILGAGPSPYPALEEAVRTLDGLGAECIVIACNSAHHWFDPLTSTTSAKLLHIADAAVNALEDRGLSGGVGVLATRGALRSGFYQRKLADAGFEPVVPADSLQADVDRAIALVKASEPHAAGVLLATVIDGLAASGVAAVLLACTELPVALAAAGRAPAIPAIDVTLALAREALVFLGYLPAASEAAAPSMEVARSVAA